MRNIKCSDCAEYRNEWCEKIIDSPHPDIFRDCQYWHKRSDYINRQDAIDYCCQLINVEHQQGSDEMNYGHERVNQTETILHHLEIMPSAQPEPIRINLNEPIKVKLTDLGKEIYYHQYDKTNQFAGREVCKPKFPKEDENGYTEFQLWCFIELYGVHMGMTLPNVIEPLEIVYERGKG